LLYKTQTEIIKNVEILIYYTILMNDKEINMNIEFQTIEPANSIVNAPATQLAFIGNPTHFMNKLLFDTVDLIPSDTTNIYKILFNKLFRSISKTKETITYYENKYDYRTIPLTIEKPYKLAKPAIFNIFNDRKINLKSLFMNKIDIVFYIHMKNKSDGFTTDKVMENINMLKNVFKYVYLITNDPISYENEDNLKNSIITDKNKLYKIINDLEISADKYNISYLIKKEVNRNNNYPIEISNTVIDKYQTNLKKKLTLFGGLVGGAGLSVIVAGVLILPIPIAGQIIGGTSIAGGILAGLGGVGGSVLLGAISVSSGVIGNIAGDFSGKIISDISTIKTIDIDTKSYHEIKKYIKGDKNKKIRNNIECIGDIKIHQYNTGYIDVTYVILNDVVYKVTGKFRKNQIANVYDIEKVRARAY
jgi:hypothetical protein